MKNRTLLYLLLAGMLLVSTQAYAEEEIFTLWAEEDSFVLSGPWAGNNFGNATYLRVRDSDEEEGAPYQSTSRSLIKFSDADLDTLSGWNIVDVSLSLYEYNRDRNNSGADTLNLFGVTGPWNEGSVTWDTQPTYEGTNVASRIFGEDDYNAGVGNYNGWKVWQGSEFNTLVEDWVTGAKDNNGLMLEDDIDGAFNEMNVWFYSSECSSSAVRPYLTITTTTAPEPISAVLFGIGAGCLGIFGSRRRRKV
jgi:hypothetical protein